jgi:hypothetical protein
MYVKHDIAPDDFYKKSETAQQLLLAFTQHEIEEEARLNKKNNK